MLNSKMLYFCSHKLQILRIVTSSAISDTINNFFYKFTCHKSTSFINSYRYHASLTKNYYRQMWGKPEWLKLIWMLIFVVKVSNHYMYSNRKTSANLTHGDMRENWRCQKFCALYKKPCLCSLSLWCPSSFSLIQYVLSTLLALSLPCTTLRCYHVCYVNFWQHDLTTVLTKSLQCWGFP